LLEKSKLVINLPSSARAVKKQPMNRGWNCSSYPDKMISLWKVFI